MDVIEFAEKFCGAELFEWQKDFIRKLEKLGPDINIRIVTGRRGKSYIYPDLNAIKELTQNGATLDSHQ